MAATVFVVVGFTLLTYYLTGAAARADTDVGARDGLILVIRGPFEFLAILWSNLQNHLLKWTLESIGVLGWLTVALPTALYVFVLVAGIAFFFGRDEEVSLQTGQRMLLAAVAVATFVSMAVVLFVYLPVVNGEIGFQGRYLAPVWLLILLSAYGIRFAKWRLDALAMIGMLLVIMVVNLQTLATTYGA